MNQEKNIKILITLHGVRTAESKSWQLKNEAKMKEDKRFKKWLIINYNYGYLFAVFSLIPFIRWHIIRKFRKFLIGIVQACPNAEINIMAHSYGTLVAFEALKKYIIPINKLILISSVIKTAEPIYDLIEMGVAKGIYNFCSKEDYVCKINPFGHSGYNGFRRPISMGFRENPYPNVYNKRYNVDHWEWWNDTPPDFFKIWRDLLHSDK